MRLHRPVLAGLALGTVLPITAASAATGVTAAGSALSSATIASIQVGSLTIGTTSIPGASIALGTLAATAETVNGTAPSITFVPATVNGQKIGAVTVTPANSPQSVAGIATPALPLNIASATSPAATLTAVKTAAGPASKVTANLGSVTVLGMPISLNGGLNAGSVTDAKHAEAGKVLKISNVTLPSLADLLAALGIDIKKLPVDTLLALVNDLPMAIDDAVSDALGTQSAAIDTIQGQIAKQNALADATTALDAALAAVDPALLTTLAPQLAAAGVSAPLDSADWDTIGAATGGSAIQTALRADGDVDTAATAYEAAKSAASGLPALDTLTSQLAAAINTLANIVGGVLNATPLAKIGAAEVGIKAAVGSAKTAKVTGYVSGVQVLGEDVLLAVTKNTKVDAAALVGGLADKVNNEIASITQTLSDSLSALKGATGLNVPAPSIEILTRSTKTGTAGAFGTADAMVSTLSVTVPSVTVPDAFALAGASSLPAVGATSTGIKTAPLSFKVGTLVEAAKFRPASSATPGKVTNPNDPDLASTGAPAGLGIVALIGLTAAVVIRRRVSARSEA